MGKWRKVVSYLDMYVSKVRGSFCSSLIYPLNGMRIYKWYKWHRWHKWRKWQMADGWMDGLICWIPKTEGKERRRNQQIVRETDKPGISLFFSFYSFGERFKKRGYMGSATNDKCSQDSLWSTVCWVHQVQFRSTWSTPRSTGCTGKTGKVRYGQDGGWERNCQDVGV